MIGLSNPFTQYIKFLPSEVPLPTFWNSAERELLRGTTLEAAIKAKTKSLDREFTMLQTATALITWCERHWWGKSEGQLSIDDWKWADAIYRSRALDLPGTGHAIVPCIEMANHASGDDTTALYETDSDGNAILVLRPGKTCEIGEEVTITYGDEKGACEMLFSYGFIEDSMVIARELYLDLDIPDDDPLRLAKRAVSNSPPGFKIFARETSTDWEGPFVWLLCVNEEDGLEFQLLRTTDDKRELQVLWHGVEIRDISKLDSVLRAEPLWDLYNLRAIMTLQDRTKLQLALLDINDPQINREDLSEISVNHHRRQALKLRDLEQTLMIQACEDFEQQVFLE